MLDYRRDDVHDGAMEVAEFGKAASRGGLGTGLVPLLSRRTQRLAEFRGGSSFRGERFYCFMGTAPDS